ncbi:uncharacterized protein SOCE26_060270 [Sorangium cellulosum]|uniref:Protein kinase domain-containing protein n=1 Tax=Sorangium cellulosum TaxID=56 RepID=A0A2L0EZ15_SORCE|nr:hypothetical protein [Sorangium cellulosum]AUX44561.1 uncharacterized protein SOCE26_060270 [Sorangium cellulosum]
MSLSFIQGTLFDGRYRVVRGIATGAMGVVYEVVHVATERRRALKVMHPHLAENPAFQARFKLEARIAARIAAEVVGSVTGWMALDASSLADEECYDIGDDVAACSLVGKAAGARAKDLGLVSTIGFSAGAVLAGTAVVLFLTEPSPSRPPASAVSWSLLAGPTGGSIVVSSPW